MSEEMPREQAIRVLEFDLDYTFNDESKEALRMGIDALKVEPCKDTISRQAAIDEIRFGQSFITKIHPTGEIEHLFDKENKALEAAVERIMALPPVTPQEPSNDMVSRGVFEQVMWERDLAIEQLKELGYGFGEKQRTGHWIKRLRHQNAVKSYTGEDVITGEIHTIQILERYDYTEYYCSECGSICGDVSMNYCCVCGAKMVESQEKQCADCNHYGKLSLDCGRCDDDCSMFEPQESEYDETIHMTPRAMKYLKKIIDERKE